jgi:transcriptional regulator with XRE-family HTH domain
MNRSDVPPDVDDVVAIGARLRAVRRQLALSLQEVEAASDLEFRASVLGAYERGDRAVSVSRLQRLARFYGVPVAHMLPGEHAGPHPDIRRPLTIDLVALRHLTGHDVAALRRYVRAIEVQRGDYNGRVLTLRRDDALVLGSILGCPTQLVPSRLEELGLRADPLA